MTRCIRSDVGLTRRAFLRRSAGLGMAVAVAQEGSGIRGAATKGEKLNIAMIGAGGRGFENLEMVRGENIVALCDVDDARAAEAYKAFPKAKRYRDYRQMLEREKGIEAVVVSVPDHSHAAASVMAMRLGKHVYCEKPLGRTIWEVRRIREVATETGVVTQMGQQGHAFEGTRRAVEVIRSGVLGAVREVHVWTDRPAGWWPQGVRAPVDRPPVPATLDWDLWLGPAAFRPYHSIYVPFQWRGFYDFGTGAMGDMAVHNFDTAYWGLELGVPTGAEVKASSEGTPDCPPLWSVIELQYPGTAVRPPVTMTFYDGKKTPPAELFLGEPIPDNGSLIVGSKGTLLTRTWHGGETAEDMFVLLPRKDFAGYAFPKATLPRGRNHHAEWIEACKGGAPTQSNFGYASALTEGLLVGLLAVRTGRRIEWDTKQMEARGVPEAARFITPEFRSGWAF